MKKVAPYFTAAIICLCLTGCDRAIDKAAQAKPQEETAPAAPKKIPVESIDFSKYPGVIKNGAFGFYFGLSQEQIEKSGIPLETEESNKDLDILRTKSAPTPWADADLYTLIFSEGKLLKIVALGKDITGDITGSAGKAQFAELKNSLTEKYGKPANSLHSVGKELWDGHDEFYQCLNYSGCGMWVDIWELGDRSIVLSLESLGKRGEGFMKIVYEATPEWSNALEAANKKTKEKTKAGL